MNNGQKRNAQDNFDVVGGRGKGLVKKDTRTLPIPLVVHVSPIDLLTHICVVCLSVKHNIPVFT